MKTRHRQRGIALVALLAIITLGAIYVIYAMLNTSSAVAAIERSKRDADVLQQAKAALIGQIALQAANTSEPNPGRLPCPEKTSDANTANEGLPENALATGHPFGYCGNGAAVIVGRLPWKALGVDKLQDSATEALWYAVAPAWIPKDSATNLVINSDTPASGGLLSTATPAEDAVAVIFAPGQALPGQSRTTGTPAVANYLDLQNGTLGVLTQFAKTGPGDTFNDHVITITRAELMPEIEAAVSDRFSRQIAPSMRSVYAGGGGWTGSAALPLAVTFADPSVAASFEGSGATRGLLPLTHSTSGACTPAPCIPTACATGEPLCAPGYVSWQSTAIFTSAAGAGATPTGSPQSVNCTPLPSAWPYLLTCKFAAKKFGLILTDPGANFSVSVTASNVGSALRQINSGVLITDEFNNALAYTVNSAVLNADGSATVNLTSSIPAGSRVDLAALLGGLLCPLGLGFCSQYTVNIPIALFSDHPIVAPTNTSSDWFFRNNWHQVAYYAVATNAGPGQAGCTTGTDCLTVNNVSAATNFPKAAPYAANSVKGLMLMAGRQLSAQARPNATLSNYLEDTNATAATTTFTARAPTLVFNRTFNDRVVVIDHN